MPGTLKLGNKVLGGFAVIVLLLVAVAAVSLINLSRVVEDVGIANTIGEVAMGISNARQAAVKVVFRGTGQAGKKQVRIHVEEAHDAIGQAARRLDREGTQKKNLNRILDYLDHFQNTFDHYLALDDQKQQTMSIMEAASHEVMDQVTGFQKAQQTQVITTRQQTSGVIARCMSNATDAAQLARLVSMARVQEKTFLSSNGDVTWSSSHAAAMKKILALTTRLKARLDGTLRVQSDDPLKAGLNDSLKAELNNPLKAGLDDPAAIQQINEIIAAIAIYQANFATVIKTLLQQQQTVVQMDVTARDAMDAMQVLRDEQNQLLMDVRMTNDSHISNALNLTEEINTLMQMLMAVQKWYTKIVYEGARDHLAGWEKALELFTSTAARFKWLLTSDADRKALAALVESIEVYRTKLQAYAVDPAAVSKDDLATAEARPFELIDEMRHGFSDQLYIAQRQTSFTLEEKMYLAETANVLIIDLQKLRQIEGRYLMSRSGQQRVPQFTEMQSDIVQRAEEMADSLDDDAERQGIDAFLGLVSTYGEQFGRVCELLAMRQNAIVSMESAANTALTMTETFFTTQADQLIEAQTVGNQVVGELMARSTAGNDLLELNMAVRLGEKQLLLLRDTEQALANEAKFNELLTACRSLRTSLVEQADLSRMDRILEHISQYGQALASTTELIAAQKTAESRMLAAAYTAQSESQTLRQTQTQNMFAGMANSRTIVLIGTLLAIVIGVAIAILLTRSITAPLRRAVSGLNTAATQVTLVAGQMASTGQALASGSSQQAASIENASASLEEITSMSRQSASSAGKANDLMQTTGQVVEQARHSMSGVTDSMTAIDTASQETSRIIKTIDEIAFQTNLLALNAAVEAARAGEAGAGFAVVADEVRNLSLRAAEAADNTGNLIQTTVERVIDGSQQVNQTSRGFDQVSDKAAKVLHLVGEIAGASHEQAQGIKQVTETVTEMNKITQQNAANAEESASMAEELSAQAEEMRALVNALAVMMDGKRMDSPPSTRHDLQELEALPQERSLNNLPVL